MVALHSTFCILPAPGNYPHKKAQNFKDVWLELERLSLLSREQLGGNSRPISDSAQKAERRAARGRIGKSLFAELLRLARIEKYGSGSEKLSEEQLALLELEPGVSQAEVEAESERAQLKLPLRRSRKVGEHPGRQELPAHLPRVEKIIPCTSEQCVYAHCGKHKELIGYETSEQLDVEPAKHFVLVT